MHCVILVLNEVPFWDDKNDSHLSKEHIVGIFTYSAYRSSSKNKWLVIELIRSGNYTTLHGGEMNFTTLCKKFK